MGGSITVIIRKKDGTIIKSCRWTNTLPQFIGNLKFIEKDDEHLENYLKTYYDLKKDWETNKDSGKFQHYMTTCYAPYNGILAPTCYGIVVIDYLKNHLLSMQGYSTFNGFDAIIVKGILENNYLLNDDRDKDFQELWSSGKIDRCEVWDDKLKDMVLIEIKDYNHLKEICLEHRYGMFLMKSDPWNVIRYEESSKGLDEIKAKILELGFEISEADEKIWEEFKKERYEH